MIIRAKFTKGKDMKYISHLDLMRLFQRTFRRADVPVKYSEGFNPHPKLSFATALALGVSSDGEYMDVELDEQIDVDKLVERINNVLPDGIKILKAAQIYGKDSVMSMIRWSSYIIGFTTTKIMTSEDISDEINKLLSKEELIITKEKKKGKQIITKQEDAKDRIKELFLLSNEKDYIVLKTTLMTGSQGNLRPEAIVELLEKHTDIKLSEDSLKIHRLELFVENDGVMSLPI